ncbi:MAG TPA: YdcF family protein [Ilumatobacteraceae bacterium]|nr:YdcF family protein [Ilumatobacteraceae bacterium]
MTSRDGFGSEWARDRDDLDHLGGAFARVFDFLALRHEITARDAIFCFGSRDPDVPAVAAALFHDGAAPWVVTTGGVELDDGRCEAAVFADDLAALGVPTDRIIVEGYSTDTSDNVVLGVAALAAQIGPVRSLLSVAWPFAARRCVATLAVHHPEIAVCSVPATPDPATRSPLNPATASWANAQLATLIRYGERGLIVPQAVPADVIAAGKAIAATLAAGAHRPGQPEWLPRQQRLDRAQHVRIDQQSAPAAR